MFFLKVLMLMFFCLSAHAMNQKIEIDSKLYYNGKKIGSPRILATEGQRSKIIMTDQKKNMEYNLEVFPSIGRDKKIILKYHIAIKDHNHEIISRGSIKINNDQGGRIYLDHGRIQIHLKIKKT